MTTAIHELLHSSAEVEKYQTRIETVDSAPLPSGPPIAANCARNRWLHLRGPIAASFRRPFLTSRV